MDTRIQHHNNLFCSFENYRESNLARDSVTEHRGDTNIPFSNISTLKSENKTKCGNGVLLEATSPHENFQRIS